MPAAGAGTRFGGRIPKQYAGLRGRTVIEWALAPFLADGRCAGAAVALASGDTWWPKVAERIPAVTVCQGGSERSESVRNALLALNRRAGKDDWVLVHDAARPCLPATDLDKLLTQACTHAVGGILALPVADTLKRACRPDVVPNAAASASASGTAAPAVEVTVDRGGLWRASTPQMFRFGLLLSALEVALAAKRFPTDESQAVEWQGHQPLLVEGSTSNIKVTTAADLALADSLLAARGSK
ncbi:MAG TPA: 2-C-methyl-D-erythritol 4-phosphate cytidylyltransferase [Polyangiaceae bacterium]|nr:2-C-methyl-D-erythritol 4-phosphate cytidylyltransferase [Polyangiaceae bacterium]